MNRKRGMNLHCETWLPLLLPGLVRGDSFALRVDVVEYRRDVNVNADYHIALGAFGTRGPG